MKDNYILSIETSCDDTSIAIIKNGQNVIKNLVASQIENFAELGGVIPEAASRLHFENFDALWRSVFNETELSMDDIDAIAVCAGPGLAGALIVGVAEAKSLAMLYNKPIIEVNHLNGHLFSCNLDQEPIKFPALALLISGGHTELRFMKDENTFEVVGETYDDALGETYDKLSKMLGWNYPGGPIVEKHALNGKNNIKLSIPKNDESLDFSFSGLKSQMSQMIFNSKINNPDDLCCSFQTQVTEVLIKKINAASKKYKPKDIVICGGVVANTYIRENIKQEFKDVKMPILKYANDNAAMIGAAAYVKFKNQEFTPVKKVDIKLGGIGWN